MSVTPPLIHSIILLLAVLLIVGLIVLLTTAQLMAHAILHPPRMTDGKAVHVLKRLSPGDLELPFSEQRFHVCDSAHSNGPPIELAAWWIPAATQSEKTVVFLHGYADAKVGSIAWAPAWHSLGFHILAIDLRAHGESTGHDSTAGFFERHDVNQLLDQLRSQRPEQTRELVLFGISMGAAVALATAALRDDLTAVVIDSPFADYRTAIRKHLDRIGLPAGLTARMATWLAQINSSANFAAVRPILLIPEIPCPLLMIRGQADDFLTESESRSLDEALLHRSQRIPQNTLRDVNWIVPTAEHLGALQSNPTEYTRQLADFLTPPA